MRELRERIATDLGARDALARSTAAAGGLARRRRRAWMEAARHRRKQTMTYTRHWLPNVGETPSRTHRHNQHSVVWRVGVDEIESLWWFGSQRQIRHLK